LAAISAPLAVRNGKAIQRAPQTRQSAFCVMRRAHDSDQAGLRALRHKPKPDYRGER
jgi:hypothetical protein